MSSLKRGDQVNSCQMEGRRVATIMGTGKAVPVHVFPQKSFPDYYFEITNSNHMVELKAKFAKICEKTMIEKRHLYTSDDLLRSSPSMTAYRSPSHTLRQELADVGVPQLGAEAARNAIADWGKQVSHITHLVFCTSCAGCLPGADWELINILGLPFSTKRTMLYQAGCFGGGSALRHAKDLAENNIGARVLVVCSEVITSIFRGPSESHIGNLVGQAIFGDAAAAMVVGCVPDTDERPLFEIVSTSQEIIPGTRDAVVSTLREEGIVFTLHPDVPMYISSSIGGVVERALQQQYAVNDDAVPPNLNKVFWMVHAGGREILDRVESGLGLRKDKLEASRDAMRQYGNTRSSCTLLVMEEMRRRSEKRGMCTAGEGLDLGMLVSFGPGLTFETIILRALSLPIPPPN